MHCQLFAVTSARARLFIACLKCFVARECIPGHFYVQVLRAPMPIFDNLIADLKSLQQFARIHCTLGILRETESNSQ